VLKEDRYRKKMGLGQEGNSLIMLIGTLAILFCVFKFVFLVYRLSDLDTNAYYHNILNWLRVPADFDVMAGRPWTLLTYMFIHDGVFSMLGNLLWLAAFGYILQDLAGNSKLVPLYLYGGLAGGLFYVLCYTVVPKLSAVAGAAPPLEGAAASVMCIAIATTALAPDYRIFPMLNGGIPLWVLTIVFVIVDLAALAGTNSSSLLAHVAGAATGLLYVFRLRKGRDWAVPMNKFFDWITNLFNPERGNWKKTAKYELHYKSNNTQPYKKIPNITQKRIDEILDKINQQGYRFLTDEEREILKRASEDDDL
jgi:membrane associated rhomboid family serine protease